MLILLLALNLKANVYQLDFNQSEIRIATTDTRFTEIKGCIELNENFQHSKLKWLADNMSFASTKISGDPENFTLQGKLTIDGEDFEVDFHGRFIGVYRGPHQNKVVWIAKTKIKNGPEVELILLGRRPNNATMTVFEDVQEIVR